MQKAPDSDEPMPGGRFALALGVLCILLFGGAVAAANWDTKHRTLIESTEIVVMPDEGDTPSYFPAPADLKVGNIIAKMDGRPLYLQKVEPVSYADEDVLAIGIEDLRVHPIYQLRTLVRPKEEVVNVLPDGLGLDPSAVGPDTDKVAEPPAEDPPNYLLLRIAPGSYLAVRDRLGDS